MVVYISGPITGMSDCNREAFAKAEADIKASGLLSNDIVINPIDIGVQIETWFEERNKTLHRQDKPKWADYMRACIQQLCNSDAVFQLDGWEDSKGAMVENRICYSLNIPCANNLIALDKIVKKHKAALCGERK